MAPRLYRWYYNRASEAPQVWSLDDGDQATEINVIGVTCRVPCKTKVGRPLSEAERQLKPYVWMEAIGELHFENGVAVIE